MPFVTSSAVTSTPGTGRPQCSNRRSAVTRMPDVTTAQRPGAAAAFLKRVEKAGLSEEQVAKVKEIAASYKDKLAAAKLSKEQQAARTAALKKAKADGLDRKATQAAVAEAVAVAPPPPMVQALAAQEARLKGYEGDACRACGQFTLVRNGTCLKCNTCGETSGCS